MEEIINNENSFKETLKFLKKYFDNVKIVKTKNSDLAYYSQNFYKLILFSNRGVQFSLKWNYNNCTLFCGDITKNNITSFQYSFTKMKLDNCYPIEKMNNYNVMFWEIELVNSHDDLSIPVSPFRLPVNLKQKQIKNLSLYRISEIL